MSRRQSILDTACTAAHVGVDQHRASKGVLCSIENTIHSPKRALVGVKSPIAKKQRRLVIDQGAEEANRLDVSSLFSRARSVLRQPPSGSIQPPIGREQQSQLLVNAVQDFVVSGAGRSLYVSGLPGTGKSHTVRKVLQQLNSSNSEEVTITWVNCMSVTASGQVYSHVASSTAKGGDFQSAADNQSSEASADSDLDTTCHAVLDLDFQAAPPAVTSSSGNKKSVTYKQLVDGLSRLQTSSSCMQQTPSKPIRKSYRASRSSSINSQDSGMSPTADSRLAATPAKTPSRGRKAKQSSTTSSSSTTKHIIVLDEIDNLMSKSQADLVQLFLLPHAPSVHVMVIGIANSIDLTERMLPELKLKMCSPQLICFPAYTTKQLSDILTTCLDQLPCKLFEPTAVELCSRSVGTSSGDLRHALKACRAAVDELERQQQQLQDANAVVAATAGVAPTVTVKYMMNALARLAGVRSSHFGAQATSSIRTLPNQQQLLLYSLSVLCSPKDAVDTTSNLWATAGTASALSSSKSSKKGFGADSSSQQVFVLAVGLEEAFTQYKQVCKLLSLPPCSRAELQHMAELLAQMALVDIIRPAAGSSCGTSRSMGSCGAASFKGLGGRGKGLGGLGSGNGLSKASGLQQDIRLCLKASVAEVESALTHNPALRCLVDK